jgi:hypothetical protein
VNGPLRPYEVVAPLESYKSLRAIRAAERRAIEDFLSRLARVPGQHGDLEMTGDDGRLHQVKFIGRWIISYRADHAVREIRVTGLEPLE